MNRLVKKILLLTIMMLPTWVLATAQQSDVLIIADKELNLNTNPLEKQLETMEWKPPEEARIWSSNWRGYIATWKIENNQLYLKEVTIQVDDPDSDDDIDQVSKSILKTLFPSKDKIFADWYSGALIAPDGEMTNYVHMGYGSTYERYQILRIKNGNVIEHLEMSQDEFTNYKNQKFKKFKETSKFKQEFNNLTNGEYNWPQDQAINFMQSFYAEYYLSQ